MVGLPTADLEKLASGVAYTLTPVAQGDEYQWEVRHGVRLVRP